MTTPLLVSFLIIITLLVLIVAVLLWRLLKGSDELRRKNDVIIREVEKNIHLQDELRQSWQNNEYSRCKLNR